MTKKKQLKKFKRVKKVKKILNQAKNNKPKVKAKKA